MSAKKTELKTLNEVELVRKLIGGDFTAFESLFTIYHKRLFHFALSLLKNEADAEDVVQEVFVKIWENREKIKTGYSFKSFIFTIAYNIVVSYLRKHMSDAKFREKLINSIQAETIQTIDHLDYKELDATYQKALNQLPPKRKRIYHMHRELGMSYKEIAGELDISPNTVRNQFAEALKFLRDKMQSESLLVLLFIKLFL